MDRDHDDSLGAGAEGLGANIAAAVSEYLCSDRRASWSWEDADDPRREALGS